ncbi:MAG: DUF1304 family protein [Alteromonas sp.]|nr:DUF1304 family protein [Flavobacteriaceae bacterium]MCB9212156.1 DUF1304 family protein [Alteromonas sp.]
MPLYLEILIGFVAFLHLYFFYFETFAWTTRGPKIFRGFPKDLFEKTKAMMANQGLYNGFLAAGLIWTFFIENPIWKTNVSFFFLGCVVVAGIVGAWTVSKRIFFVQAVPAIITIVMVFLNSYLSENPKTTSLPDPLEAGWKGHAVCEVLQEDRTIRVLKCTFPPGVGHEKHEHAPHFGFTLKGSTFRITDEKGPREVNVPAGYDFYKSEPSVHEVLNIGDSTAVFLIIEPK